MIRKIYLCLLLTTPIVQQIYKTKHDYKDWLKAMLFKTVQYLKKTNKHKDKSKKDKKSKAPLNIGQEN